MYITSIYSISTKLIVMLISFLCIPLLIQALGTDGFGAYLAFVTFWGFMNALDFGTNSAIINSVREDKKTDIYSIYINTFKIIFKKWKYLYITFFLIGLLILPLEQNFEKIIIIIVYVFLSPINISLNCALQSLISRGKQKSNITINFINVVFQTLCVIYFSIYFENLYLSLLIFPPTIILFSLLYIFHNYRKNNINFGENKLTNSQKTFFLINILTYISYNIDTLIISKLMDSESVAIYGIYQKIFFSPGVVIGSVSILLWGKIAGSEIEKKSIKNKHWNIYLISIFISMLVFLFSESIFDILSNNKINYDFTTALIFTFWTALHIYNSFASSILNGLNLHIKYKNTLIKITIYNIFLSIIGALLIGIKGPILASVISMFIFTLKMRELIHES